MKNNLRKKEIIKKAPYDCALTNRIDILDEECIKYPNISNLQLKLLVGTPGIYFLYNYYHLKDPIGVKVPNGLVYIGSSQHTEYRIIQHDKENKIPFDFYHIHSTSFSTKEQRLELEEECILRYNPPYNKRISLVWNRDKYITVKEAAKFLLESPDDG